MSEMCVHGVCKHPKHIQSVQGFVEGPIAPIAPVVKNIEPKHVTPTLITGDDALKLKAEHDKNAFLVSQNLPQDAIIKRCTRH